MAGRPALTLWVVTASIIGLAYLLATAGAPVARAVDWELVEPGEPALQLFAPTSGALFARTAAGLKRSDDGGTTWRRVPLPRLGRNIHLRFVAVDPTDHTVLFANGERGVYRSTDDAATWTALSLPPGTGEAVRNITISAADPAVVYVSRRRYETSGDTLWQLVSTDRGDTWELRGVSGPGMSCGWVVITFVPHPSNSNRAYRRAGCHRASSDAETGSHLLEHSADLGATWQQVTIPRIGSAVRVVGGRGAEPGRFYLASNLASGRTSGSTGQVFRSENGLDGWTLVLEARGAWIDGLAYDPEAPDHIYAGTRQGSALNSSDGGASWMTLGRQGLGAVHDLTLGIDGRNLYAATERGVWRYPLDPVVEGK